MGKKAKSSRKGKKAWRANISTEDIHDLFDKSTKDALSGGSLSSAPSESLFFVDKSKDLSVKRKIEKNRAKVLRSESVLQKNQFVQPFSASIPKKFDKRLKRLPKVADVTGDDSKDSATASDMTDLWGDEGGDAKGKTRKIGRPSIIPAVEVDPPGCSYNPTFDSHQDVLACAVADEMQKVYKNELGPKPVPLLVPGEIIDDEDRLFLEADDGSEDDMDMENADETEDAVDEKKPSKTKRVTRVELNKRARRKERLKKESELKKMENLSKEIDSLPDILQEMAEEDEEKQNRHIRRVVARQERLKSCPPRLGKYKFQPAPMQVLLSEELTGSLRKIKACSTLAKDRFKSLQKRGVIAPYKKMGRK